MSLFRKHHKLKAVDSFAFVGPAGNIPKPVKENETKTSKVLKDDNCTCDRNKVVSTLTALGLTQKGEPEQDDSCTIYKFDIGKDGSLFDRAAKFLMYKNNIVFGVKGTQLWVRVGPSVTVSDSDIPEENVTDELVQSASKKALGENIATEIKAGKEPKQAAAIAYSVQRANDTSNHTVAEFKDKYCVVFEENLNRFHTNAMIEGAWNTLEEARRSKEAIQKRFKRPVVIVYKGAVYDGCKTDIKDYGVKISQAGNRYCVVSRDRYNKYGINAFAEQCHNTLQEARRAQSSLYATDRIPYVIVHNENGKYRVFDSTSVKDELGYHPNICGCMDFTDLENIVHTTIQYIKAKYPNEENTMEKWLSLIGEEFGELCQAINDGEVNNVIEEGTQTIAAIYLMLSDFIINANVMASLIKE